MFKQTFSDGNQALKYAQFLVNRGFQVSGKGDGVTFYILTDAPASYRESALFSAFVK